MTPPNETVLLDNVNSSLSRFIASFAASPTPQFLETQLPSLIEAASLLGTLQGKQVVLQGREASQLRRNVDILRALLHQFGEFHRALGRKSGHSSGGYAGLPIAVSDSWNDPTVIVES